MYKLKANLYLLVTVQSTTKCMSLIAALCLVIARSMQTASYQVVYAISRPAHSHCLFSSTIIRVTTVWKIKTVATLLPLTGPVCPIHGLGGGNSNHGLHGVFTSISYTGPLMGKLLPIMVH